MSDHRELLMSYSKDGNAEAFSELVREYSGMVYATCLRVTRNTHDAEDAAQNSFLDLARKAQSIRSSVAGWLHAAAVGHASNTIRRNVARRDRELSMMTESAPAETVGWEHIAPSVDAALEDLPEDMRVPLILHYLQGKNQTEVARELGLDQSTVSRRIEKGLEELRGRLKKAGVIVPAAVLATLLTENAMAAVPATLLVSLGKMALAGVGHVGPTGAVSGVFAILTAKSVAVIAAGILATVGLIICTDIFRKRETPVMDTPKSDVAQVPSAASTNALPGPTPPRPLNSPLQEFTRQLSSISRRAIGTNGALQIDQFEDEFLRQLSSQGISTNNVFTDTDTAFYRLVVSNMMATATMVDATLSNQFVNAGKPSPPASDHHNTGLNMGLRVGTQLEAAHRWCASYSNGPPREGTPEWDALNRTMRYYMTNMFGMMNAFGPGADAGQEGGRPTGTRTASSDISAFHLGLLQSSLHLDEAQSVSISNILSETYALSSYWGLLSPGTECVFTPEAREILRQMTSSNAVARIVEGLTDEQHTAFTNMFRYGMLFEFKIEFKFPAAQKTAGKAKDIAP